MRNHLTEETIIDYIEHELSREKAEEVQNHLNVCSQCKELHHFWTHTLNEEVDIPETQQKHIWKQLSANVQHNRKRYFKTWYKGIMVASIAALLFMTGFFTGGRITNHETAPNTTKNAQSESFVIDTDTEIYDLVHTSSGDNKGYAWYNPVRKEMILYIDEDLQERMRADIETSHSTISKGPINLNNEHKYFYIKDHQLQEFYRLILTNQFNQNPISSYEFRAVQLNNREIWK
ncbi:anti-sigma factor family protein [Salinibacillus kushneri]|nr:zf-HC2 domain-containing protein [Salinibacillus kushneri]